LLHRLEQPAQLEQAVELFHSFFGSGGDIVLRTDQGDVLLTLLPEPRFTAVTRLDLNGDVVTVRKSVRPASPVLLLGNHAIDPAAGTVSPVRSPEGWGMWERVRLRTSGEEGVVRRDDELQLPLATFRSLALRLDPGENRYGTVLFTREGRPATPRAAQPSYHLRMDEEGDSFSLSAVGRCGETLFTLPRDPFSLFTAEGRAALSGPLRTRRRWDVLVEGCFGALHAGGGKELDTLVRSLLDAGEFLKRKMRAEGREVILSFLQECTESRAIVTAEGDEWVLVEEDPAREALLLESAYRMFGAEIFCAEQPGRMLVPEEALLPRVGELHARLAEEGFSLHYGDRPVRSERWEFSIDATSSGTDWFELRPEIRCGGELVSEEEAARAFSGGLLFRDGACVILDPMSGTVLAALEAERKKKRGSKVVRIPRLRILDWLQLRHAGVSVLLSEEDARIFRSLLSFEGIPEIPLAAGLRGTLRQYQADGYRWLAFLYAHRFGACLADDMGLGKTVQAISLLAALREGVVSSRGEGRPHLIVVPPTLLFNWEVEIARFYPEFRVAVYRGSGRQADFSGADVVLTSYGIVQRDAEVLSAIPFDVVVLDEAQAVKNIGAATTGACRRLRGEFTLTLTGTPVENHLGEFFSVIDLSVPGLLGAYEEFRRGMKNPDEELLQRLSRRTRPFLLRRSKEMIADELPPKVETDIYLEMTPQQKGLYARTAEEARRVVRSAYAAVPPGQARMIALTAILRLRQICLSPQLAGGGSRKAPPRVEFLAEQLAELIDEGHSVLVFSQF
ncbi:MAG TPA: SNF2-related protein, partial [Verrucomicrobiae bacterium]|nr:SNF2-related protein [Verrucomicrobiae bacterium]